MRVTLIEKSLVMLNIIETNICFLGMPANEIIVNLTKRNELKGLTFLFSCNSQLENGVAFPIAWHNALHKKSCSQVLKKDDVAVLLSFASGFGTTDKDGQISNCRVHSEMLREKLSDAKAQRNRYASMSTVFGILSGVCVFIIFI